MKHYEYLSSDCYVLDSNSRVFKINKELNCIKFRQIVYTITSIEEVFNGYDYLTIYKAEALRDSAHNERFYELEISEDDTNTVVINRTIYIKRKL